MSPCGIDGGKSFYQHPGPTQPGDYAFDDLSVELNAFLDRTSHAAGASGSERVKTIPFQIRSDSVGRATIALDPLDYTVLLTHSWPNPADKTLRLDQTYTVDFCQETRIPLDAAPNAGKGALLSVTLDIEGVLGQERLFGADFPVVSDAAPRETATVNSDFGVAQPLTTGIPLKLAGVALRLDSDRTDEAAIFAAIQANDGGEPAATGALTSANVTLAPAPADAALPPLVWTTLLFDRPAEIGKETPVFLMVKGARGALRVGLNESAISPPASDSGTAPEENGLSGPALYNRGGGQTWKPFRGAFGGPRLQVALIAAPDPEIPKAPLEIGLERGGTPGVFQRITPGPSGQPVRVILTPPVAGPEALTLIIRSHARGSLTISRIIQEFTP